MSQDTKLDEKSGPSRRAYDSSGRRRRAEERREAVIDAAAAVFATKGFDGTTVADIAEAAGVSIAYFQKIGTKAELFILAIERVTVGPQQRTVQRARDELEVTAADANRDEFLQNMADLTTAWNERSYGMWRAWANSDDPELRAGWEAVMRDIRAEWAAYLAFFDQRGWWRTDVPRDEQVAAIWLFTLAETYERMTVVAGLSREHYTAWLRRAMESVLVGAAGGAAPQT
jgi:AcrR family transcriptional regulator